MSDSALEPLLQETVARHVAARGRVVSVRSQTIGRASSGGDVQRHEVGYRAEDGREDIVSLVTKSAALVERKAWQLLNRQGQAAVPFSHALDYVDPGPGLLCMDDVGETQRP